MSEIIPEFSDFNYRIHDLLPYARGGNYFFKIFRNPYKIKKSEISYALAENLFEK